MDASRAHLQPAGVKSRQPIRQPEKMGQIELTDELLIFGERGDDFSGMLCAEPLAENGSADDFGRQGCPFAQRIDAVSGGRLASARLSRRPLRRLSARTAANATRGPSEQQHTDGPPRVAASLMNRPSSSSGFSACGICGVLRSKLW
jgi:hypothetical protein